MSSKASGRKTVSIDERTYRKLVRAKAQLELEEEEDISLAEALGAIVVGGLAVYTMAKLWEEYKKSKGGELR